MIELWEGGDKWLFDEQFLRSRWRCAWGHPDEGRRCPGIGDERAPERAHGCCSLGAELLDDEEARTVAALAATLDPAHFAHHGETEFVEARRSAGDERGGRWHTRVVDDACVFLNPVGFIGGVGCALHLAAVADGELPLEYKPSVCWQVPLKIDHGADGSRHLRAWNRSDWGPGGATMAWWCTEDPDVLDEGREPVWMSLHDELDALLGPDLFARLRARLAAATGEPAVTGCEIC